MRTGHAATGDRRGRLAAAGLLAFTIFANACGDDGESATDRTAADVFAVANRCHAIGTANGAARYLARSAAGTGFAFSAADAGTGTPFFLEPAALATYLLYDDAGGFVVSDGSALQRATALESDVTTLDDSFVSEAEWELQASDADPALYQLRHRKSGRYLGVQGLTDTAGGAAALRLDERGGCAEFPEEGTHAQGRVAPRRFEDGAVYGFVDAHSHILANYGFGGGGIFHGAPYHRLGVQHALPDCARSHGEEGRADLFGYAFDTGLQADVETLIEGVLTGRTPEFNHATAGWPEFTEWPNAPTRSTHQVQYYKWLERAYLGGLRLVVQHAVSNQIICDFLGGRGIEPVRYSCNDMVGVDRQIREAYAMQDYIDAQEGGPGRGWFRVVTSPAAAREVIAAGKMAVVLGIETSNLFDCFLTPPEGFARCTEQDVIERLDAYHARGVRALFPVHKFDNGFSAGDGHKTFIEIGNVLQSSNFNTFTDQCDTSVPSAFDSGPMTFPGLNEPREDYFATPPNDFSRFYENIQETLTPLLPRLFVPPVPGVSNHCQSFGMTALGEFLIREMMRRGMIIEVDHLPRKSYKRAYELLEANDYPAAGTHGLDNFGKLYALGGISTSDFGRCHGPEPGTVDDGFQARLRTIVENGGYPGLGFGFDLNGFAGARGPRFGPRAGCGSPQSDPVTYPFSSYAGDVTFEQPRVGNRSLDFNTEGLVHIGLLPEMIEDVRRDGVPDADLEPLFRSAEAYIRMWEKAERRGAALRSGSAQP